MSKLFLKLAFGGAVALTAFRRKRFRPLLNTHWYHRTSSRWRAVAGEASIAVPEVGAAQMRWSLCRDAAALCATPRRPVRVCR